MNGSALGAEKDEATMDKTGSPQALAGRQGTGGATAVRARGGAA
jgi:hypothetical protein